MQSDTSTPTGGRGTDFPSEWERIVSRADYQVLLDQARRIWQVHQRDLNVEGGRRPEKD